MIRTGCAETDCRDAGNGQRFVNWAPARRVERGQARLARLSRPLEQIQSQQENDGNAHKSGEDLRKGLRFEEVMEFEEVDDEESQDDDDGESPSHLSPPEFARTRRSPDHARGSGK